MHIVVEVGIDDSALAYKLEFLGLGHAEARRNADVDRGFVLKAEIDMLYEIFMAASLPQYLKERVGERVAEMKHALTEGEENEA